MTPTKAADSELNAISDILSALDGLDGESIQRVFDYVFSRLSIATPRQPTTQISPQRVLPQAPSEAGSARIPSIRDLKDEKQPESSNQMAAVVAYYLSEILWPDHKDVVTTADLEKYFKQGGFKLPKQMSMTLPNATAAGYFDAQGNGVYKLNPVGYNLVVHGLPRSHTGQGASRRKAKANRTNRG